MVSNVVELYHDLGEHSRWAVASLLPSLDGVGRREVCTSFCAVACLTERFCWGLSGPVSHFQHTVPEVVCVRLQAPVQSSSSASRVHT